MIAAWFWLTVLLLAVDAVALVAIVLLLIWGW